MNRWPINILRNLVGAGQPHRERIAALERQVANLQDRLSWEWVSLVDADTKRIVRTVKARWHAGSASMEFFANDLTAADVGRSFSARGWPSEGAQIVCVSSSRWALASTLAGQSSDALP